MWEFFLFLKARIFYKSQSFVVEMESIRYINIGSCGGVMIQLTSAKVPKSKAVVHFLL